MVVTRAIRDFCSFLRRLPVARCNILHLSRPMTKLCTSSLFSISLAEFYSSNNLKLTIYCDQSENRQYQDFISDIEARTLNTSVLQSIAELFVCVWIFTQIWFIAVCHWMNLVKVSLVENADNLQKAGVLAAAAVQTASFPKMPPTRRCRHPQMADMVG